MISVGLTGGFGTGKTTVLELFRKAGAKVLSSDAIVHDELEKNKTLQKKISKFFGPGIVCDGLVRRRRLAQKVFSCRDSLEKLNALVHPIVKKRIYSFFKKFRKRINSIVVVEVPLLFETGFNKFFDWTVVVAATPQIQKKRFLKKEQWSLEERKRRMQWQLPLVKKIVRCDFVIDNNGTKKKTICQVKNLMGVLAQAQTTALYFKDHHKPKKK